MTDQSKMRLTGGIVLETEINEEAELKLALTGEYGKSAGKIKNLLKRR